MPTFIARFTPQAWVNDYAVEIDHDGPDEWDCTEAFNNLPEVYRRQLLAEMAGDLEALDAYDHLKDDPAAPEWVRLHRGPFDINIHSDPPVCEPCKGRGHRDLYNKWDGHYEGDDCCPDCNGSGFEKEDWCYLCDGHGIGPSGDVSDPCVCQS